MVFYALNTFLSRFFWLVFSVKKSDLTNENVANEPNFKANHLLPDCIFTPIDSNT